MGTCDWPSSSESANACPCVHAGIARQGGDPIGAREHDSTSYCTAALLQCTRESTADGCYTLLRSNVSTNLGAECCTALLHSFPISLVDPAWARGSCASAFSAESTKARAANVR
jgi:hypothetical protein